MYIYELHDISRNPGLDTLCQAVGIGGDDIVNGLRNLNACQYETKCLDANTERTNYGMLLDGLTIAVVFNLQGLGK